MLEYCWCGKYEASSPEWIHIERELEEYELFIVTDGVLYIADHEKNYTVNKGEYFLMSPTKNQRGYKKSYSSFYFLHFTCENLQNTKYVLPVQGTLMNIERIIILLNQLQDTDRRYHDSETSNLLAIGILLEIKNQLQTQHIQNVTSKKNQLYQAMLDYIKWNCFRNILVTELAEYFGYHQKYLSTFFKEMSGMQLKQYLMRERMEYAKAALMDSTKTVTEIAEGMGFDDHHNFSHAFKKVTGLTPTEYRTSCIKIPKTP